MPRPLESADGSSVDRPQSKPQPLYLRLYFRPHLVEFVRLVGYEGIPLDEAQKGEKELRERYGEKILEAGELVTVDTSKEPHWVRLAEQVRRLAFQMLGPPPRSRTHANRPPPRDVPAKSAPPTSLAERHKATDGTRIVKTSAVSGNLEQAPWGTAVFYPEAPRGKAVYHPRNSVIPKYQEWLDEAGQTYVTSEQIRKSSPTAKHARTLDFIVQCEEGNLLVTVRLTLSARQKADMAAWQDVYGKSYRAVRVWLFTDGFHWDWQYVPLEETH